MSNLKHRIKRLETSKLPDFDKMTDEQLDEWCKEAFGADEWERMKAEMKAKIKAMSNEELRALL